MIFGRIFNKEKPNSEIIMTNSNKAVSPDTVESKMSKATKVYKRMINVKDVKRKDIIAAFMKECALTKAGSATYFNTIKKKLSKTD